MSTPPDDPSAPRDDKRAEQPEKKPEKPADAPSLADGIALGIGCLVTIIFFVGIVLVGYFRN